MQTTVMFFDSKQQSVRVYNEDGIFFVSLSIKKDASVVGAATKKFYTMQEALDFADTLLHDTTYVDLRHVDVDDANFIDDCAHDCGCGAISFDGDE